MKPNQEIEDIIGKYLSYGWLEKNKLYLKAIDASSTETIVHDYLKIQNVFMCKIL